VLPSYYLRKERPHRAVFLGIKIKILKHCLRTICQTVVPPYFAAESDLFNARSPRASVPLLGGFSMAVRISRFSPGGKLSSSYRYPSILVREYAEISDW